MADFGERLRQLRKQRGITTQVKFADQLGIRQSQVSDYERGQVPKFDLLNRMATVLNTTVDYLTGRTDDPEPPLVLSEAERAIILRYRQTRRAPTQRDADRDVLRERRKRKPKSS